MDSKKWMFIFAALGGFGGLACIFQWAEIKPKDLWGWHLSLAVPHGLWLTFGMLLFAFSIGLSLYSIYRTGEVAERIPKQTSEVKPQQWKPAWKKLQWANSERERLEKEVEQLKTSASQDTFTNPKWETVDDSTFKNTTVELDGKDFWRCKFENVTLVFHGRAPVQFGPGNEFKGSLALKSDHPAAKMFANLLYVFRSLKGEGKRMMEGHEDSRGKMFPDNFVIVKEENKNEASQQKLSQYPIPQLRTKVLGMVSELQGFLGEHGQEPEVKRELPESPDVFMQRWRATVAPWRAKFVGDYLLKFRESVPQLRDEIRARAGIDDFALNLSIDKAERDPNGNRQAVEGIVKRFWDIALEING